MRCLRVINCCRFFFCFIRVHLVLIAVGFSFVHPDLLVVFCFWKGKKNGGAQGDPIVLKITAEDNGKRCQYCIKFKEWRGLNHTEEKGQRKQERRKNGQRKESDDEFVKATTANSTSCHETRPTTAERDTSSIGGTISDNK